VELAERDEVVDAVLAATQPLGGLGDVQPRRDDGSARRDESRGALGDLGELLIGVSRIAGFSSDPITRSPHCG
jgi:hypothetical protein